MRDRTRLVSDLEVRVEKTVLPGGDSRLFQDRQNTAVGATSLRAVYHPEIWYARECDREVRGGVLGIRFVQTVSVLSLNLERRSEGCIEAGRALFSQKCQDPFSHLLTSMMRRPTSEQGATLTMIASTSRCFPSAVTIPVASALTMRCCTTSTLSLHSASR